MDGKVCSQQSSLCSPHPSSPAASPPPRNPAVRCLSLPTPRQHPSQLTSPTSVEEPLYFLWDFCELSMQTRGCHPDRRAAPFAARSALFASRVLHRDGGTAATF